MQEFAEEMTSVLYGNPHSGSVSSQLSSSRIEDIRLRLLNWFRADPDEYDVVFVPNATAGVKLVVEAMRALPQGYYFAYHEACHTSLIGVREDARGSVCLKDDQTCAWVQGQSPLDESAQEASATLFAYTAQSHMNGRRYPLSWSQQLSEACSPDSSHLYTLLDAASYCATSQLDLSTPDCAPDFTVLSLYKIFGFPDLGALLIRRSSESVFDHRKYFGGGTVDMVVCGKERWHAPKSQFLHERLEDGTLPFHSIMAVDIALKVHRKLFGSMDQVKAHTSYLTQALLSKLANLRHGNGQPVCVIYTDWKDSTSPLDNGPVVSLNILNRQGAWISLDDFEKLANLKGIHIRTGGLCSPGSIAAALALEPWEMKRNFSAGFRCGTDNDIIAGKPTGVIRVSFGAMSTMSDVSRFVSFLDEFFVEGACVEEDVEVSKPSLSKNPLVVQTITVYPIKSCGGYRVPVGSHWEIRPEGLAWDREWCLLHQGSGQALSQKRYPQMALLKPELDFDKGLLTIKFHGGPLGDDGTPEIAVPLSADPSLQRNDSQSLPSWVCGDEIWPQKYSSSQINDFFTETLGVPCVLARFPPGGHGLGSRALKARAQGHQPRNQLKRLPGSFPDPPSPPDSDSERQQGRILLSNESPILMIHRASFDALRKDVNSASGAQIKESAFRANIVVGCSNPELAQPAYAEDSWHTMSIGLQSFKIIAPCRRCQMVCVDQMTGEKDREPFVTLAKTRRIGGKVYFGMHMQHVPKQHLQGRESQNPTIQVGDPVYVDASD